MSANLLIIIKKLPYRLRDKWRSVACDFQERYNQRATFRDLVNYLEKQVRIATDPVFGDIRDTPTPSKDGRGFMSKPPHPKIKGSTFATTVTVAHEKNGNGPRKMESWPAVKRCLFCGGGHALEVCFLLEKKAHHEKITFLKENGACFGCLQKGHMSKDCRKRLSCNICNLKHPQMLHIHQRRFEMDKHQAQTKEEADIRAIASVQTSGLTGAGEDNCKLSIVPVKVKAKKGNTTVHTYAFLDPGSTASFCTLGLMNKLNLQGRKSNILLRTMGQRKVVETSIVSGLEVTGLHGTDFCDLPCVYTQKTMPVHKGNIPHQNDINQWHHLKNIHLPELDCEIELLIGSDVPKALEPLQVIRSVGDGPYAVKTMLGWTVNGPLGRKEDERKPEEAVERLAEQKRRQDEEERKRIEEEKVRREEEQRLRSQEEALERLAEEKRRQAEERKRIEEEEKVRREEEQMILRKRQEEEEQVRREEQQQRERLEEEKKRREEQERKRVEEERIRMEEERVQEDRRREESIRRQEEECRLAQEKRKEEERIIEEEKVRRREVEECEAKRKLQDQEKKQQEERIWKRWIKEYLPQLQERQKWSNIRRNFTPGDIVIIVDDSAPRNSWLTGRIVETIMDKKGLVRQLRIKSKTGFLTRPITKVCLLLEAADH
ncbi:uncharacterized protein LOC128436773 [Pleuronectes platessa]|uniref:uncharacterized protein LOC128436773 n=2 Tax=Pleuronectes platessa TaxID=8262 RepID=UPI00232A7031|nr:uncharacterized protein LOC128436773 [Pleuronectes platessa]